MACNGFHLCIYVVVVVSFTGSFHFRPTRHESICLRKSTCITMIRLEAEIFKNP